MDENQHAAFLSLKQLVVRDFLGFFGIFWGFLGIFGGFLGDFWGLFYDGHLRYSGFSAISRIFLGFSMFSGIFSRILWDFLGFFQDFEGSSGIFNDF